MILLFLVPIRNVLCSFFRLVLFGVTNCLFGQFFLFFKFLEFSIYDDKTLDICSITCKNPKLQAIESNHKKYFLSISHYYYTFVTLTRGYEKQICMVSDVNKIGDTLFSELPSAHHHYLRQKIKYGTHSYFNYKLSLPFHFS